MWILGCWMFYSHQKLVSWESILPWLDIVLLYSTGEHTLVFDSEQLFVRFLTIDMQCLEFAPAGLWMNRDRKSVHWLYLDICTTLFQSNERVGSRWVFYSKTSINGRFVAKGYAQTSGIESLMKRARSEDYLLSMGSFGITKEVELAGITVISSSKTGTVWGNPSW